MRESRFDILDLFIFLSKDRVYHKKYTTTCISVQDLVSKYNTPIIKPIEADSGALSWENKAKFMKGVGMLGWLKETGRPDVAYAHSRISQHMANPNDSSLEALKHCACYLEATSHLAIKSNL